ncbi:hypothetical protein KEM52_001689 [Ascosphaera acerosa]|nr:hypothetical protein KEM52_001689 [Ascosphaera acerosa]
MSLPVERRVFHCVLDDTALTANISEVKKWALAGQITVFVPLYTIERLRAIKFSKPNTQVASNAGQALNFLDRATEGKYSIPEDSVALQGPLDQFEDWEDAQQYFLQEYKEEVVCAPTPSTKAARDAGTPAQQDQLTEQTPSQLNEMSQMLLSKLNIQDADKQTSASAGPASDERNAGKSNATSRTEDAPPATPVTALAAPPVPNFLKPLLSCVLWRLHNAPRPISPPSSRGPVNLISNLSSCLLVTNDWTVRNWAIKYGITVKSVHQLRTAILYEDKEYKNHVRYLERNQAQAQAQAHMQPKLVTAGATIAHTRLIDQQQPQQQQQQQSPEDTDTSEDELVFVPREPKHASPPAPSAARPATSSTPNLANPSTPRPQVQAQAQHRKVHSRSRIASVTSNANGSSAAHSPSVFVADSSSLHEPTSSPIVEIPCSPIDPDSFSRRIPAVRSPVVQTAVQTAVTGPGRPSSKERPAGPPGPIAPRGPKAADHAMRWSSDGSAANGYVPTRPRRRGNGYGGGAGSRSGSSGPRAGHEFGSPAPGAGRGFGGAQRGRGKLWVP